MNMNMNNHFDQLNGQPQPAPAANDRRFTADEEGYVRVPVDYFRGLLPGRAPATAVALDGSPAGLTRGIGYIFPLRNTTLHIIDGNHRPFEAPNQEFGFKVFRAPCHMTIRDLLERLGATRGADNENGVTECVEIGDGSWERGLSVFKSHASSTYTLAQCGWDGTQAEGADEPVWLSVSRGQ